MGKIIDKVRQREFNAMLYRRALERNECSAYSRAIPGAGADWPTANLEQTIQMRKWVDMASYAPLPKSSNSG